jgi:hypothetical protein
MRTWLRREVSPSAKATRRGSASRRAADPIGVGGATLVVLGVAFSTSVIAAWPAMYGNPTTAVRHD